MVIVCGAYAGKKNYCKLHTICIYAPLAPQSTYSGQIFFLIFCRNLFPCSTKSFVVLMKTFFKKAREAGISHLLNTTLRTMNAHLNLLFKSNKFSIRDVSLWNFLFYDKNIEHCVLSIKNIDKIEAEKHVIKCLSWCCKNKNFYAIYVYKLNKI